MSIACLGIIALFCFEIQTDYDDKEKGSIIIFFVILYVFNNGNIYLEYCYVYDLILNYKLENYSSTFYLTDDTSTFCLLSMTYLYFLYSCSFDIIFEESLR